MTRDQLLEHIRPLVEDLAGELASILWADLEVKLDQALDAARSALISDLQSTVRADDCAAPSVPTYADVESGSSVRTPRRAAPESTAPKGRKPNTCSKCGTRGFTAATCGRTHNVTPDDGEDETDDEATPITKVRPPPPPIRADRFSAIEVAAAKRRIADRAARVDAGARPSRGVHRAVRADAEPEVPLVAALPEPTFSTVL